MQSNQKTPIIKANTKTCNKIYFNFKANFNRKKIEQKYYKKSKL